jgi:hypothetical protein
MKRLLLLTPLCLAVVLLSGCPDKKLPTPTPKVPEPKTQSTALGGPSESRLPGLKFDRMPASRAS